MPQTAELTPETFALVESALPGGAKEFVRLIGIEATLSLVNEFGGQDVRFPKHETGAAADRFAHLTRIVGRENAARLAFEFGDGGDIYIPCCSRAIRLLRNRTIAAEYGQLLRNQSARNAAQIIAKKYGLSSRCIEVIVNNPIAT